MDSSQLTSLETSKSLSSPSPSDSQEPKRKKIKTTTTTSNDQKVRWSDNRTTTEIIHNLKQQGAKSVMVGITLFDNIETRFRKKDYGPKFGYGEIDPVISKQFAYEEDEAGVAFCARAEQSVMDQIPWEILKIDNGSAFLSMSNHSKNVRYSGLD